MRPTVELPAALAFDADLTASDLRVLMLQLAEDRQFTGQEIAQVLGLSLRQAYSSRRTLIAKGLLAEDAGPEQLALVPATRSVVPLNAVLIDTFGQFWSLYPRKEARARAQQAWLRLQPGADLRHKIIANVMYRAEHDAQWLRGFVPHAATYLNGRRWEDQSPQSRTPQKYIEALAATAGATFDEEACDDSAGIRPVGR